MSEYSKFEKRINEWLSGINLWQGVLYSLIVCRRFYPLYLQFSEKEKWGDPRLLFQAEEIICLWLDTNKYQVGELQKIISKIEDVTPDSEDFLDCEDALDAASVHIYSLESILKQTVQPVQYVARYCYDSMDRKVMDILLPNGGAITIDIESEAEKHSYIQDELNWQNDAIDSISKLKKIPNNIDSFCAEYTNKPV